jgi:acetyl esterase/lipase
VNEQDIFTAKPSPADRRLTYGPDPNQFIDVRFPAGNQPVPVVFFIHGGYWRARYDLTYAGHLCEALKKAGIATWNVEYRRVGNPGGGWPGTFEDIRGAYRLLRNQTFMSSLPRLDLDRVVVAGHSAGGQLGLCLAAHEKTVTHAIALAGVLDLRRAWELHLSNDAAVEFLGGSPKDVPEHYREASPAELPITHARQLIIHGTADADVPYEISRNYAERKKKAGEPVEMLSLPDEEHFAIVDPGSKIWPKIQEAFLVAIRE